MATDLKKIRASLATINTSRFENGLNGLLEEGTIKMNERGALERSNGITKLKQASDHDIAWYQPALNNIPRRAKIVKNLRYLVVVREDMQWLGIVMKTLVTVPTTAQKLR